MCDNQHCMFLLGEFTEFHAERLLLGLVGCSPRGGGGGGCVHSSSSGPRTDDGRFLTGAVVQVIVDPQETAVVKDLQSDQSVRWTMYDELPYHLHEHLAALVYVLQRAVSLVVCKRVTTWNTTH